MALNKSRHLPECLVQLQVSIYKNCVKYNDGFKMCIQINVFCSWFWTMDIFFPPSQLLKLICCIIFIYPYTPLNISINLSLQIPFRQKAAGTSIYTCFIFHYQLKSLTTQGWFNCIFSLTLHFGNQITR